MRGRLHRLAAHASQLLRSTSITSYHCGVLKVAAYPFPSGGSLAGFSGWAPREYPFKPPLKRIKVEGRYMPNPALQGYFAQRPSAPPKKRRDVAPRQRTKPQASKGPPTVPLGRRLGKPNAERVRRDRSAARAASVDAGDESAVIKYDLCEEEALSHNSGLQILFLGTGTGHPAEQRRVGTVAMKLPRSTWLFDCGEDTQRQVHKQPLIRHGKLDRIFITNCSTANILGLPAGKCVKTAVVLTSSGFLCTMSAAREVGLDLADNPLHLYGPPGLAEFIRPLLQLSDTYISMPILVHEFVDYAVTQEMAEPQCLDRRSCLFRRLLPPDKLNPQGFYDGEVTPFLSRAQSRTNQMAKGVDERVNPRELDLPPPASLFERHCALGNPDATLEGMQDLRWTIRCDRDFQMTAARVTAESNSWAYICQESSRVGRLSVERCEELKVPRGTRFSWLKEGKSVLNEMGEVIHPDQVVGPDIPGRKIMVVGDSLDSSPVLDLAKNATAIIHSASSEVRLAEGLKSVRSTISMASLFAREADAQHLLLYRIKPGNEDSQAPYRRVDSLSSSPPEELSQEPFLKHLNTLGSIQTTKRAALGGYLWRAKNYWEAVRCPANIVGETEKYAADIFARRKNRVSVASDMDLFAVDRFIPKAEWESKDAATERQTAVG